LALQSCHEEGSARGERSQLSAMRITRDQLLRTVGDAVNAMIVKQRPVYEAANAEIAEMQKRLPDHRFLLARHSADPKRRWVDGTPEYSLSVFALRKLFPEARFIHILRDVREVVRSLMNFKNLAGYQLVDTEEAAYRYWLRTVRGCLAAECAFGSDVVRRVRYRDLVKTREPVLRGCLEFLGETYTADCLTPLDVKINSSNVPHGFDPTDKRTPAALRQEAHDLSDLLDAEEPAFVASAESVGQLEMHFLKRAHYVAWAERELARRLDKERSQLKSKEPDTSQKSRPPRGVRSVAASERARNDA
jgi:hypothetical protein